MEELVYRIRRTSALGARVRMQGAFSVWWPVVPSLLKEWACVQLRFGMVGPAMEVGRPHEATVAAVAGPAAVLLLAVASHACCAAAPAPVPSLPRLLSSKPEP